MIKNEKFNQVATCALGRPRFAFTPHRRTVYPYQHRKHLTPARKDVGLLPKKKSLSSWVKKYEENIIYHAAWRVNLFFLLLIFYHQKIRIVQVGKTTLQHGKGMNTPNNLPNLHACHSSLLPGLTDHDPMTLDINMNHSSIIDGSFLHHWNNMTVGCPDFVNLLLDHEIEKYSRKFLVSLLTSVSMGYLDPHTAMKMFYKTMHVVFHEAGKTALMKCDTQHERDALKKVIRLQKKGTFLFASRPTLFPKRAFVKKILDQKKKETCSSAYKRTQKQLQIPSSAEHRPQIKDFLKRFSP